MTSHAPLRRLRGTLLVVLGVAAWTLPSCRDIPAPEGNVQSLGPLRFPLPGLVAGDTMRDSTGAVAPLTLVAFDVANDTVANVPATFVTLDTGAHLSGALLIGDSPGVTVRVVGEAAGLETQPASVKVTLSPDTLVALDSGIYHQSYRLYAGDTVAASPELAASVRHRSGATTSGVEAVIVKYSIDRAPPSNGQGASVVLMGGSTPSSRDTTDAAGRASRVARLRVAALSTFAVDTVLVSATASYRGQSIGTVTFTVIFTALIAP